MDIIAQYLWQKKKRIKEIMCYLKYKFNITKVLNNIKQYEEHGKLPIICSICK